MKENFKTTYVHSGLPRTWLEQSRETERKIPNRFSQGKFDGISDKRFPRGKERVRAKKGRAHGGGEMGKIARNSVGTQNLIKIV